VSLRARLAANALLAALVGATAVAIVGFAALGPEGRIGAMVLAFGCFGALFLPGVRGYALTKRRVLVVGTVLVLIALIMAPHGSYDIWSYAAYGRLVSVHHVSPFTRVPADFPHDPMYHLVGRGWRHTGSVYGPGFVAVSAAGTALTGSSELATRLFFQLLEALALGGVLLIVWRRTRDPVALAFVALNPALIMVVNDGHNDIVVGLTLLAGTLLLADGHPRRAGLVLGAGALVKLVLVLPLGALMLWTWRRRGPRDAMEAGATAAIVLLAAYLLSGGAEALGPLLHATEQHSRSSLWQIATQWLVEPFGVVRPVLLRIEANAAIVLVTAIVVFVVLLATRGGSAHPPSTRTTSVIVAGTAALAFLLAGAYILPWYSAWCLPVLALAWRSRVAVLAAGQAALISVAYAAPQTFGGLFGVYAEEVLPLVLAGALAYLLWSAWRGQLDRPVGACARPSGASTAERVSRAN